MSVPRGPVWAPVSATHRARPRDTAEKGFSLRTYLLMASVAAVLVAMVTVVQPPLAASTSPRTGIEMMAHRGVAPDPVYCSGPGEAYDVLCGFPQANWQGYGDVVLPGSWGQCINLRPGEIRSYWNHSIEGVLFEGQNCGGRALNVLQDSSNPDIGFTAHSWRERVGGAPLCTDPNVVCLWPDAEYGGELVEMTDIGQGNCYNLTRFGKKADAYQNNSNFEGYLYESEDCTSVGLRAPVMLHDSKAHIGFDAHSWKQECVSCLSGKRR